MIVRASGRAALILAAGFWVCASAPLRAQDANTQPAEQAATVGSAADTSAEAAKPARQHSKKTATKSRKSDRHAQAKKAAEDHTAAADESKAGESKPGQDSATLAPGVANANAQWATDASPTNTYTMSAQAGTMLNQMGAQQTEQPATASPDDSTNNNMQVVAADQLNDLDRAAEDKPPLTLAKATIDAPAPAEAAAENSNSPWQQTSLIGKIFIAFGGLLTVASAARMFMA